MCGSAKRNYKERRRAMKPPVKGAKGGEGILITPQHADVNARMLFYCRRNQLFRAAGRKEEARIPRRNENSLWKPGGIWIFSRELFNFLSPRAKR